MGPTDTQWSGTREGCARFGGDTTDSAATNRRECYVRPMPDASPPIRVNRAPVLTLWDAVVAERLGHPPETALTLGRFVAGSSARAKARRFGIVEETEEAVERRERARELRGQRQTARLLGREIRVLTCAGRYAARRG